LRLRGLRNVPIEFPLVDALRRVVEDLCEGLLDVDDARLILRAASDQSAARTIRAALPTAPFIEKFAAFWDSVWDVMGNRLLAGDPALGGMEGIVDDFRRLATLFEQSVAALEAGDPEGLARTMEAAHYLVNWR
jgi:hypothetical protein